MDLSPEAAWRVRHRVSNHPPVARQTDLRAVPTNTVNGVAGREY